MSEERSIYVEVEENDNCEYMPMLVYESHQQSVQVSKIIIDDPGRPGEVCDVTGWSSEGGGLHVLRYMHQCQIQVRQ